MYLRTVDQAFLRIGLDLGWVTLAVFAIMALIPLVRVLLKRTEDPAEIALAATFPILLTVALLLQWQSFLWMLAGLAATSAPQAVKQPEPDKPSIKQDLPDSYRFLKVPNRR